MNDQPSRIQNQININEQNKKIIEKLKKEKKIIDKNSSLDADLFLSPEISDFKCLICENIPNPENSYEAICCGSSRGFTKNGNYYIFTEGFSFLNDLNNPKIGYYVLKASSKEYSYYLEELKKYYKASSQRHRGSVYSTNFSDGNQFITLQYNTETGVMIEITNY